MAFTGPFSFSPPPSPSEPPALPATKMTLADLLHKWHTDKLSKYEALLSGSAQSVKFWDVVVLTACDPQQAASFEDQLKDKLRLNRIPASSKSGPSLWSFPVMTC